MAVVEMKKLNLVAMSYDKDGILDALQSTGAVEVKTHTDTEDTFVPAVCVDEIKDQLMATESALELLLSSVSAYEADNKIKADKEKDGFFVTYEQFLSAKDSREEVGQAVAEINRLSAEKHDVKARISALDKQIKNARIYSVLTKPFDYFQSTGKTHFRLGCLPTAKLPEFADGAAQISLMAWQTFIEEDGQTLILSATHKDEATAGDELLSKFSFIPCPFTGEKTGEQTYQEFLDEKRALLQALAKNEQDTYALKSKIQTIKIYIDYLTFVAEKGETEGKLRRTERTFLLEAYLPVGTEEQVKVAVEKVSKATYIQFSDLTEEDNPPTLLANNSIVSNFEGITNTYSVPAYKEFDPNAVMSFFYALFMGFIVGDWGYGVTMLLVGGYLWWKNRAYPTGMSRLAGAFAFAGLFAVLWGSLFNSFFGFALFPYTIMPDPQTGRCKFVGIEVPSVLAFCLVIGVLHLCVGYLCKAYQHFRRKEVLDGIFDGVLWAIFSVGVMLAIVGLIEFEKYPLDFSYLLPVGGIMAGVSLLLAVLTAGRKEKFAGKFIKGFGTLYGIINYASDIVSYARLYGLMLSGAVIAQIISNAVVSFFAMGNVLLIALGIVLMVVGHLFNIVISLLGAYIHDARLQYVEFYGKFYEGEGELFRPLGSTQKYVRLTRESR